MASLWFGCQKDELHQTDNNEQMVFPLRLQQLLFKKLSTS